MDRERVRSEIAARSREELLAWRKHAVFCLEWYTRDNSPYEIEECQFVIDQIDRQLALSGRSNPEEGFPAQT